MRIAWPTAALLALVSAQTFAQAPPCTRALSDAELARPMTGAERQVVVEALARMTEQLYVDRTKGKAVAAALRRNAASGRYRKHTDAAAFAEAVTQDMQAVVRDKHLKLRRQRIEPATPVATQDSPDAKAARLARFKRGAAYDGYGIREVKILPGNVGYLSLGEFWTPTVAAEALGGAMSVLKDSDALIIDVRDSYGGHEGVPLFVAGYLLSSSDQMYLSVDHLSGERVTGTSTPRPAAERLRADVPVYVLTSKRKTFSAAEMLALALQRKRGATIVGEQTRGGANGGDFRALSCRFDAFVPYISSTVDGINWEGVGIAPDVTVPEQDALDEAYRLALAKLVEKPLPADADGLTREIREERLEMLDKANAAKSRPH